MGSVEFNNDGDATQTNSVLSGIFTITSDKTFRVDHRADNAQNTNGFGRATVFTGETEIYTSIDLVKIGS
jgi:hypothetical protein